MVLSKIVGSFVRRFYIFGQARHSRNEYREEEEYGFGRVIVVPNKKKSLEHSVIKYD